MSNYSTIRQVIAAAAISAAIGLTSLTGGSASADGAEKHYLVITLKDAYVTAPTAGAPLIARPLARNAVIDGSAQK